MESTNVEEESPDAAAYGLVALCDSNFEVNENQISEETVVETSDNIVTDLSDVNAVQFLLQNIQEQQQQQHEYAALQQQQQQQQHHQQQIVVQEESVQPEITMEEQIGVEENQESQLLEFDNSAIAIVQSEDGTQEEIDIQSLQAVAQAMEKSGVKVKVESKKVISLFTVRHNRKLRQEVRSTAHSVDRLFASRDRLTVVRSAVNKTFTK